MQILVEENSKNGLSKIVASHITTSWACYFLQHLYFSLGFQLPGALPQSVLHKSLGSLINHADSSLGASKLHGCDQYLLCGLVKLWGRPCTLCVQA